MPDRSTPLQRTILHALRPDRAMTAGEVFVRLGVARPDVADSSTTAAVRAAVARNLDVLTADGWIERDGGGYVLAQRILAELAA